MSQRLNKIVYAALIDKSRIEIVNTEGESSEASKCFTVSSGTITYNQDTDTKVSGKIDIAIAGYGEGDAFINTLIGSYVRLYTTKPGGKGKKLLCTMLPSVKDIENNEGSLYTGTVELKSPLCALTENEIRKTSLKKGTNIYKKFVQYARNYGCEGLTKVVDNIEDSKKTLKFSKNKVFQTGSTPYDVMKYMASKMNAYITVTPSGYIYLKSKSTKATTHLFSDCKMDNNNVITSSLTVTDNGVPTNRVIAYHEKTENKTVTRYYSKPVVLSSSNLYSRQNLGRNITVLKKCDEEDLKNYNAKLNNPDSIRSKLTVIAKEELRNLAEKNYSYTFKAPFIDEVQLGDKAKIRIGKDIYNTKISGYELDLFRGCEATITCTTSTKPKISYDRQTKKL